MKKIFSLLLSAAMSLSLVATTAFAASGNVTMSMSATEVEPGETITVTIGSLAKSISTEGFNVQYDKDKVDFSAIKVGTNPITGPSNVYLSYELDEYGEIITERQRFSIAENNAAESKVAFGFANTNDVAYLAKATLVKVEFVVKADATGDVVFTLNENSAGANGYVGVADTQTVTVKAASITPVAPAVTSVTIDPTATTVNGGESTTFTATVEGTDGNDDKGAVVALDKSVTWTATAGTIVDGVFTAPEATETEQTITVTATSVADATKSASATVTVPAKPVVVTTTVTVTDAKATQNAAYKSQNTMYWGVKITNGLKGNVTAQLDAGEDDKSKVTTLDFSGVTINGDAEFGVYTKLAAERLDKAIKLVITDVESGVVGESTAASYNSLQ